MEDSASRNLCPVNSKEYGKSKMNIKLWYNSAMGQWRWTMTDKDLNMEAGEQPMLRDALNDVANTVEHMLDKSGYLPEKIDLDKIDYGDTHQ